VPPARSKAGEIIFETTAPPPPARWLGKAGKGYTIAPAKAKPTESA
jgi:hypothetical protein